MNDRRRYLAKIDELSVLMFTAYEIARKSTNNRRDIAQSVIDDLLDELIEGYLMGFYDCLDDIGVSAEDTEVTVDHDRLIDSIYKVIAGKTFEDRCKEHVYAKDVKALASLAEDEFHRNYNAGELDAAQQIAKAGTVVQKRWHTMEDNRVRDTHSYIDGDEVGINDYFVTFDGDKALAPGGFEKADNNCGCRCWLVFNSGREAA